MKINNRILQLAGILNESGESTLIRKMRTVLDVETPIKQVAWKENLQATDRDYKEIRGKHRNLIKYFDQGLLEVGFMKNTNAPVPKLTVNGAYQWERDLKTFYLNALKWYKYYHFDVNLPNKWRVMEYYSSYIYGDIVVDYNDEVQAQLVPENKSGIGFAIRMAGKPYPNEVKMPNSDIVKRGLSKFFMDVTNVIMISIYEEK